MRNSAGIVKEDDTVTVECKGCKEYFEAEKVLYRHFVRNVWQK